MNSGRAHESFDTESIPREEDIEELKASEESESPTELWDHNDKEAEEKTDYDSRASS